MTARRLILVGASGLVGSEAARQASADPGIELACPVRRMPEQAEPGWGAEVVDFDDLESSTFDWRADGIAIALGTTIRRAGSQAAFEAVDRELVLAVADKARAAGTPSCAVVSSIGADAESSNFYLRVKGEMERGLEALGFESLVIIRPSLLAGSRSESRPGERVGLLFASLFRPVIPARYRAVGADRVANALVSGALHGKPGKRIVPSNEIN